MSENEEEEEEAGSDEEEVSRTKLTVKFLGEILQDMQSMTERLFDADPVMERYLKFKRGLDDVILPYKELHRNLRQSARQLSIMDFFCLSPSTSGASAPSPASPGHRASLFGERLIRILADIPFGARLISTLTCVVFR